MKKKLNPLTQIPQPTKKPNSSIKFDWTKITDKNSSVHSEELNYHTKVVEGNIDVNIDDKEKSEIVRG